MSPQRATQLTKCGADAPTDLTIDDSNEVAVAVGMAGFVLCGLFGLLVMLFRRK